MRKVLGVLMFIAGLVSAAYVSVYCMIIQPIMNACASFDAGTLSAVIIGMMVLKIIFAGLVGSLIMWITTTVAGLLFVK